MANITNNEHQKIGGFGFDALQYWYGKLVCNVSEQDGGVWEFLRTKAMVLSQNGDPVKYTPCIANISLLYCLENKINSIHLYPRQSGMTNTVILYMQYLIESTKGNCNIYYLTKDFGAFRDGMNKLEKQSAYTMGVNSLSCKTAKNAVIRDNARIKYESMYSSIHYTLDYDELIRLVRAECPIYVIVEDALFWYAWEHYLSELKKLLYCDGKDITMVCLSTLNRKVDTPFRSNVQRKLLFNTDTVFFNDEIYFKPIPDAVDIERPAIIYTDYRHIHKDKAEDTKKRLTAALSGDYEMLMQELYLQYPTMPVNFIGR